MIESLTIPQVKEALIAVSKNVIAKEKVLNDADRAIGDGDHGSAMTRGFLTMINVLETGEYSDLTELFIAAGNALIASVGGCAGIIYGTFFRSGGKALEDRQNLDTEGFANFLEAAYGAVQHRGKAQLGDKTMIDALYPTVEAANAAKEMPFSQFMHTCAQAAKKGMEETGNMLGATGRAKDFGKNALGFLDPGSITLYTIIASFDEYISKKTS